MNRLLSRKVVVRVDNGTEWTFDEAEVIEQMSGDVLVVLHRDGTHRFPLRHVLWWIESEVPA